MNMHERIKSGKLFTDMCEGLPQEREEAKRNMIAFNNTTPDNIEERKKIQKEMLHPKSGSAWIEPPIYFCYGKHITVGEGTYINFNCNFVDDGMINIGKNVLFGPAVTIATTGHPIRPDMREYMYADPVTIKDNVWIGANVTICPGVTIGENSVIGAGSVVVKDIPANVVAGGNPCEQIREISEKDNEYYYRRRKITEKDLEEERSLRDNDQPVSKTAHAEPSAPAEDAEIPVEPMDPEFLRSIGLSESDVRSIQEKESQDVGLSANSDDSTEKLPQRSENPNRYQRIVKSGAALAQANASEPSPFKPLDSDKSANEAASAGASEPSPFKPMAANPVVEEEAPSPFKAAKPMADEEPENTENSNPFKAPAASANAPAPGLFKPIGAGNTSASSDEPSEPSPFKPLAASPVEEEAPSPFKGRGIEVPTEEEVLSNNPFRAAASSQGAPAPGLFKPVEQNNAVRRSAPHGSATQGLFKPDNAGVSEGLSGGLSVGLSGGSTESEHLGSYGLSGSGEGSLSDGSQSGSLLGSGSSGSLGSSGSESKLPQRSESTNSYYPTSSRSHGPSALESSEPSPFKPIGGKAAASEANDEPAASPFKPAGNAVPGFGVPQETAAEPSPFKPAGNAVPGFGAPQETAEPSPFKPLGNNGSNNSAQQETFASGPFRPLGATDSNSGVQQAASEPSPFKPLDTAVSDNETIEDDSAFQAVPDPALTGPAPAADPTEYSPFKPLGFSGLDDLPPLDESAPSPFKPLR